MYLLLAFFWIIIAVLLQLYWDTLSRHAYIPIDRNLAAFGCFVLFSYNFIRWRMGRVRDQAYKDLNEPPPRPVHRDEPIDPTFDFSDPKPTDGDKK